MAVIFEKTLDDEEKERLVQRAALHLFGHFALITLTAIVVLAVPGVVMWIGDLIGVAPFAAVSDLLLSWEVIIGATVLILATIWRRLKKIHLHPNPHAYILRLSICRAYYSLRKRRVRRKREDH